MFARAKPVNHLFNSDVHLPAPPGLVVAIRPSAARLSASFSPSPMSMVEPGGAANSSGRRNGIEGQFFPRLSHCPLSKRYCGNDLSFCAVTYLSTLRYGAPLR